MMKMKWQTCVGILRAVLETTAVSSQCIWQSFLLLIKRTFHNFMNIYVLVRKCAAGYWCDVLHTQTYLIKYTTKDV